jgi:hypothetical protein
MLRLAADENLNGDIVRGLLRRNPEFDIVRIQDVGLSGVDDPTVLEWAAGESRTSSLTTYRLWRGTPSTVLRLAGRCRALSP